MPKMPPTFRAFEAADEAERSYDRARGGASERLYSARWAKASKAHLAMSPLCRYCELDGHVRAATVVDHLYPHRGDVRLFWMKRLWVSACKRCHDGFKQMIERRGRAAIDGLARRLGIAPLVEGEGESKVCGSPTQDRRPVA